jgi:hypothetical protein
LELDFYLAQFHFWLYIYPYLFIQSYYLIQTHQISLIILSNKCLVYRYYYSFIFFAQYYFHFNYIKILVCYIVEVSVIKAKINYMKKWSLSHCFIVFSYNWYSFIYFSINFGNCNFIIDYYWINFDMNNHQNFNIIIKVEILNNFVEYIN